MNNNQKEYAVTFINPQNQTKKTIMIGENQIILDQAREFDMDLPACCCAAACTVCTAKVLEGTVEQSAQAIQFLGYPLVDAGYILTCAASPTSDCTLVTHQEEEIF